MNDPGEAWWEGNSALPNASEEKNRQDAASAIVGTAAEYKTNEIPPPSPPPSSSEYQDPTRAPPRFPPKDSTQPEHDEGVHSMDSHGTHGGAILYDVPPPPPPQHYHQPVAGNQYLHYSNPQHPYQQGYYPPQYYSSSQPYVPQEPSSPHHGIHHFRGREGGYFSMEKDAFQKDPLDQLSSKVDQLDLDVSSSIGSHLVHGANAPSPAMHMYGHPSSHVPPISPTPPYRSMQDRVPYGPVIPPPSHGIHSPIPFYPDTHHSVQYQQPYNMHPSYGHPSQFHSQYHRLPHLGSYANHSFGPYDYSNAPPPSRYPSSSGYFSASPNPYSHRSDYHSQYPQPHQYYGPPTAAGQANRYSMQRPHSIAEPPHSASGAYVEDQPTYSRDRGPRSKPSHFPTELTSSQSSNSGGNQRKLSRKKRKESVLSADSLEHLATSPMSPMTPTSPLSPEYQELSSCSSPPFSPTPPPSPSSSNTGAIPKNNGAKTLRNSSDGDSYELSQKNSEHSEENESQIDVSSDDIVAHVSSSSTCTEKSDDREKYDNELDSGGDSNESQYDNVPEKQSKIMGSIDGSQANQDRPKSGLENRCDSPRMGDVGFVRATLDTPQTLLASTQLVKATLKTSKPTTFFIALESKFKMPEFDEGTKVGESIAAVVAEVSSPDDVDSKATLEKNADDDDHEEISMEQDSLMENLEQIKDISKPPVSDDSNTLSPDNVSISPADYQESQLVMRHYVENWPTETDSDDIDEFFLVLDNNGVAAEYEFPSGASSPRSSCSESYYDDKEIEEYQRKMSSQILEEDEEEEEVDEVLEKHFQVNKAFSPPKKENPSLTGTLQEMLPSKEPWSSKPKSSPCTKESIHTTTPVTKTDIPHFSTLTSNFKRSIPRNQTFLVEKPGNLDAIVESVQSEVNPEKSLEVLNSSPQKSEEKASLEASSSIVSSNSQSTAPSSGERLAKGASSAAKSLFQTFLGSGKSSASKFSSDRSALHPKKELSGKSTIETREKEDRKKTGSKDTEKTSSFDADVNYLFVDQRPLQAGSVPLSLCKNSLSTLNGELKKCDQKELNKMCKTEKNNNSALFENKELSFNNLRKFSKIPKVRLAQRTDNCKSKDSVAEDIEKSVKSVTCSSLSNKGSQLIESVDKLVSNTKSDECESKNEAPPTDILSSSSNTVAPEIPQLLKENGRAKENFSFTGNCVKSADMSASNVASPEVITLEQSPIDLTNSTMRGNVECNENEAITTNDECTDIVTVAHEGNEMQRKSSNKHPLINFITSNTKTVDNATVPEFQSSQKETKSVSKIPAKVKPRSKSQSNIPTRISVFDCHQDLHEEKDSIMTRSDCSPCSKDEARKSIKSKFSGAQSLSLSDRQKNKSITFSENFHLEKTKISSESRGSKASKLTRYVPGHQPVAASKSAPSLNNSSKLAPKIISKQISADKNKDKMKETNSNPVKYKSGIPRIQQKQSSVSARSSRPTNAKVSGMTLKSNPTLSKTCKNPSLTDLENPAKGKSDLESEKSTNKQKIIRSTSKLRKILIDRLSTSLPSNLAKLSKQNESSKVTQSLSKIQGIRDVSDETLSKILLTFVKELSFRSNYATTSSNAKSFNRSNSSDTVLRDEASEYSSDNVIATIGKSRSSDDIKDVGCTKLPAAGHLTSGRDQANDADAFEKYGNAFSLEPSCNAAFIRETMSSSQCQEKGYENSDISNIEYSTDLGNSSRPPVVPGSSTSYNNASDRLGSGGTLSHCIQPVDSGAARACVACDPVPARSSHIIGVEVDSSDVEISEGTISDFSDDEIVISDDSDVLSDKEDETISEPLIIPSEDNSGPENVHNLLNLSECEQSFVPSDLSGNGRCSITRLQNITRTLAEPGNTSMDDLPFLKHDELDKLATLIANKLLSGDTPERDVVNEASGFNEEVERICCSSITSTSDATGNNSALPQFESNDIDGIISSKYPSSVMNSDSGVSVTYSDRSCVTCVISSSHTTSDSGNSDDSSLSDICASDATMASNSKESNFDRYVVEDDGKKCDDADQNLHQHLHSVDDSNFIREQVELSSDHLSGLPTPRSFDYAVANTEQIIGSQDLDAIVDSRDTVPCVNLPVNSQEVTGNLEGSTDKLPHVIEGRGLSGLLPGTLNCDPFSEDSAINSRAATFSQKGDTFAVYGIGDSLHGPANLMGNLLPVENKKPVLREREMVHRVDVEEVTKKMDDNSCVFPCLDQQPEIMPMEELENVSTKKCDNSSIVYQQEDSFKQSSMTGSIAIELGSQELNKCVEIFSSNLAGQKDKREQDSLPVIEITSESKIGCGHPGETSESACPSSDNCARASGQRIGPCQFLYPPGNSKHEVNDLEKVVVRDEKSQENLRRLSESLESTEDQFSVLLLNDHSNYFSNNLTENNPSSPLGNQINSTICLPDTSLSMDNTVDSEFTIGENTIGSGRYNTSVRPCSSPPALSELAAKAHKKHLIQMCSPVDQKTQDNEFFGPQLPDTKSFSTGSNNQLIRHQRCSDTVEGRISVSELINENDYNEGVFILNKDDSSPSNISSQIEESVNTDSGFESVTKCYSSVGQTSPINDLICGAFKDDVSHDSLPLSSNKSVLAPLSSSHSDTAVDEPQSNRIKINDTAVKQAVANNNREPSYKNETLDRLDYDNNTYNAPLYQISDTCAPEAENRHVPYDMLLSRVENDKTSAKVGKLIESLMPSRNNSSLGSMPLVEDENVSLKGSRCDPRALLPSTEKACYDESSRNVSGALDHRQNDCIAGDSAAGDESKWTGAGEKQTRYEKERQTPETCRPQCTFMDVSSYRIARNKDSDLNKGSEENKEETDTTFSFNNKAEGLLMQQEMLEENGVNCDGISEKSSSVTSTIRIAMGEMVSLQKLDSNHSPIITEASKPHLELERKRVTSVEKKSDVFCEQKLLYDRKNLATYKGADINDATVINCHAAAIFPTKFLDLTSSSGELTGSQLYSNSELPEGCTSLTFDHQLLKRCDQEDSSNPNGGEDRDFQQKINLPPKNNGFDDRHEVLKSKSNEGFMPSLMKESFPVTVATADIVQSGSIKNRKQNLKLSVRSDADAFNDKYPKMNNYEVIRRRSQNSRSSFSSIIEKSREELDKSDESFEEICWEIERAKEAKNMNHERKFSDSSGVSSLSESSNRKGSSSSTVSTPGDDWSWFPGRRSSYINEFSVNVEATSRKHSSSSSGGTSGISSLHEAQDGRRISVCSAATNLAKISEESPYSPPLQSEEESGSELSSDKPSSPEGVLPVPPSPIWPLKEKRPPRPPRRSTLGILYDTHTVRFDELDLSPLSPSTKPIQSKRTRRRTLHTFKNILDEWHSRTQENSIPGSLEVIPNLRSKTEPVKCSSDAALLDVKTSFIQNPELNHVDANDDVSIMGTFDSEESVEVLGLSSSPSNIIQMNDGLYHTYDSDDNSYEKSSPSIHQRNITDEYEDGRKASYRKNQDKLGQMKLKDTAPVKTLVKKFESTNLRDAQSLPNLSDVGEANVLDLDEPVVPSRKKKVKRTAPPNSHLKISSAINSFVPRSECDVRVDSVAQRGVFHAHSDDAILEKGYGDFSSCDDENDMEDLNLTFFEPKSKLRVSLPRRQMPKQTKRSLKLHHLRRKFSFNSTDKSKDLKESLNTSLQRFKKAKHKFEKLVSKSLKKDSSPTPTLIRSSQIVSHSFDLKHPVDDPENFSSWKSSQLNSRFSSTSESGSSSNYFNELRKTSRSLNFEASGRYSRRLTSGAIEINNGAARSNSSRGSEASYASKHSDVPEFDDSDCSVDSWGDADSDFEYYKMSPAVRSYKSDPPEREGGLALRGAREKLPTEQLKYAPKKISNKNKGRAGGDWSEGRDAIPAFEIRFSGAYCRGAKSESKGDELSSHLLKWIEHQNKEFKHSNT